MQFLIKIWMAYILDLIFGDPENIIHPVQVIGKLIEILEKILLRKKYRIFCGGVLAVVVIVATYILCDFIVKNNDKSVFAIIEIYLMYTIFSINSLKREGKKVYDILKRGDVELARRELAYLVSRDTQEMDKRTVIRSTMETISENTVDGVIAPMFYMFLGGLPLAMAYKAINTLDSMIGYRNEKYEQFGKLAARIDDVVNFVPARITGLLIASVASLLKHNGKDAFRIFFRDRKNHSSPNSGHPEASVAGALGLQFGGRTSYFGKILEKPTIGDKKREFQEEDIVKNIKIMYVTSAAGLILFSLVFLLIERVLWIKS